MSEELVKTDKHPNRHDNFNGKVGRPKGPSPLTELARKFIDNVHLQGMDYSSAYKAAGYKSPYNIKRANAILDLPAAKEYVDKLTNDDDIKKKASKSFLIQKLIDRMNKAKDSDLVQIVRTINSMLGYSATDNEIKVDNKIEIVWQPLINFDIKDTNNEQ